MRDAIWDAMHYELKFTHHSPVLEMREGLSCMEVFIMRSTQISLFSSLAFGLGVFGGCATSISPNPKVDDSYHEELGAFHDLPRSRMGALPFEGVFTLYESADAGDLGTHAYASGPLDIDSERERGIVYTRRAGFIDIAHLRNAADMTAYIHARARLAIERGWNAFAFRAHEPSTYRVELCYPEGWDALSVDDRQRLSDELAIRVAQRVAFDAMTWHEIITWYGYKSTIVIPESNSAFTHDDTTSHALGIELAAEAIRTGRDFDLELSRLLDGAMDELGAVDEEDLKRAMSRVEGSWYDSISGPKVRMLDIGTGDGLIEPWIVEGFGDEMYIFDIAHLDQIEGRDFSRFCRVSIDPNVLEGFKLREVIGEDREYIYPETDYPILIEDIARQLEVDSVDDIPVHAMRD